MDEIFRNALFDTFILLKQVLPPMDIGLFGIEFLMQLGLMQKLEPLGKPLVRASRLPHQSILAFLTAIGSLVAANVIWQGRRILPKRASTKAEVTSEDGAVRRKNDPFLILLQKTFQTRWRLFSKMAVILLTVTFIVQLLVHGGVLNTVGRLVAPAADLFGLPHQIIAPVSVYIFSPIVGITAMSPLLKQHVITEYQAIVALLAAGFLMVPVLRLRGTLPRYVSIFGWKHGVSIISITTVLSLVARAIILVWVIIFFT